MSLSTQTQADLAAILETLDQRIYELGNNTTEAGKLQALRESTAALIG